MGDISVKTKKVKLSEIKLNPDNPRSITEKGDGQPCEIVAGVP